MANSTYILPGDFYFYREQKQKKESLQNKKPAAESKVTVEQHHQQSAKLLWEGIKKGEKSIVVDPSDLCVIIDHAIDFSDPTERYFFIQFLETNEAARKYALALYQLQTQEGQEDFLDFDGEEDVNEYLKKANLANKAHEKLVQLFEKNHDFAFDFFNKAPKTTAALGLPHVRQLFHTNPGATMALLSNTDILESEAFKQIDLDVVFHLGLDYSKPAHFFAKVFCTMATHRREALKKLSFFPHLITTEPVFTGDSLDQSTSSSGDFEAFNGQNLEIVIINVQEQAIIKYLRRYIFKGKEDDKLTNIFQDDPELFASFAENSSVDDFNKLLRAIPDPIRFFEIIVDSPACQKFMVERIDAIALHLAAYAKGDSSLSQRFHALLQNKHAGQTYQYHLRTKAFELIDEAVIQYNTESGTDTGEKLLKLVKNELVLAELALHNRFDKLQLLASEPIVSSADNVGYQINFHLAREPRIWHSLQKDTFANFSALTTTVERQDEKSPARQPGVKPSYKKGIGFYVARRTLGEKDVVALIKEHLDQRKALSDDLAYLIVADKTLWNEIDPGKVPFYKRWRRYFNNTNFTREQLSSLNPIFTAALQGHEVRLPAIDRDAKKQMQSPLGYLRKVPKAESGSVVGAKSTSTLDLQQPVEGSNASLNLVPVNEQKETSEASLNLVAPPSSPQDPVVRPAEQHQTVEMKDGASEVSLKLAAPQEDQQSEASLKLVAPEQEDQPGSPQKPARTQKSTRDREIEEQPGSPEKSAEKATNASPYSSLISQTTSSSSKRKRLEFSDSLAPQTSATTAQPQDKRMQLTS